MLDVFGQALLDYHAGDYSEDIITYSSVGGQDILPLPYLFRNFKAMPLLEQQALILARGKVLDIGCGAGNHALYLQSKDFNVWGLDISPGAIETCRLRGLKKTFNGTISEIDGTKFDTLLLLMNGIGVVGGYTELDAYLIQLKSLLNPEGQILLDSSDIVYMYKPQEEGEGVSASMQKDRYYGQVSFKMVYKGKKSTSFEWLYLDFKSLEEAALRNGLSCELVMEGEHYDYLARLLIK